MDRSVSPEGDPLAILAAAENLTGMVFDDGDDEVFIKEESSSPVADDDRPFMIRRLQPFKFKPPTPTQKSSAAPAGKVKATAGQQQAARAGRHGGKGPAASKIAHLRGSQSAGQPIIPRKIEDWEPWKSILHELYITQNRILREIIGIMETKYNVRATPKMYKNQFARWGFFKYTVKKRPRTKVESPTDQSSDDSLDDGTLILSRDSLMHDSDGSRGMQVGLAAVRRFIHGHIDQDSANLRAEEVAGYVDPCYRYFKVAMDLFDLKENMDGGRILRLAFLQIERKISKPTMKSFSDLCFLVPHLLLESGRKDILAAYLRYLARLASVKFGKHPVAELAASFASLVDDRPEDIMRYIMRLSQINADTIASLPGMLDRNRQWARNQYLACQRTISNSSASSTAEASWGSGGSGSGREMGSGRQHEHHMLRVEAQSVYWAQMLVVQDPVGNQMAEEWLRRRFGKDFGVRCEAHLARLKQSVASGQFPAMFACMMECLYVGWLFDYYETVQDWDRAFEWGRRGLELSTDEQYALWSIHLEGLMRRHGRAEEADELQRRRRAHAWLEKVRLEVDRLTLG
ncbi:hypothetical protein C8A03DRAFT_16522 [Achaetomium macrosporum]|uniref:Clr5 domain-containing protein n=1 Tax=Achaetomium macrosporum TaxID=79813 RepID=A0AAN7C7X8_9PEZI|nr:hypothetical protein C8A03DRAFT_16522 [Achaetomium macrosporum]